MKGIASTSLYTALYNEKISIKPENSLRFVRLRLVLNKKYRDTKIQKCEEFVMGYLHDRISNCGECSYK